MGKEYNVMRRRSENLRPFTQDEQRYRKRVFDKHLDSEIHYEIAGINRTIETLLSQQQSEERDFSIGKHCLEGVKKYEDNTFDTHRSGTKRRYFKHFMGIDNKQVHHYQTLFHVVVGLYLEEKKQKELNCRR